MVGRKTASLLAAAGAFISLPGAALSADEPEEMAHAGSVPQDFAFAIMRNGNRIGDHTIRFSRDGDTLTALIDINIDVSFGPIPLYRYEHQNRETWRDGQLVAIETETTENGDDFAVSGMLEDGLFIVDGMEGEIETAPGIVPTSYWDMDIVHATTLLDTQRGTLMEQKEAVMTRDEALGADCYELSGDLDLTLCYTDKRLRKLAFEFDGSYIEYQPIDPES
ncbi:hypothetical protein FF098_001050 [Parvularcula flava]|uniref:Uncharacterized protein n=1 Tax=Aquisalinus luteolus TaxID=1566827 RepID=A0A8J3A0A0_9PROT|nr:DUF6134 family protein [Aquisalinus luteolus]NHK26489.1 hypothetical protein [Aquisalinus luteolus]GGH92493.1 hypothetical protein GCM10011355_02120 [Aquisalinus luteolus]